MKKMFLINSAVYPLDTLVVVEHPPEDVVKYIETKLKYKLDAEEKKMFVVFKGLGKSIQLKNGAGVLWIKKFDGSVYWHWVLNHEIFHIVYQTIKHVGIKLSDSSEEAFTYLMEYLTKQILKNLIN